MFSVILETETPMKKINIFNQDPIRPLHQAMQTFCQPFSLY